MYPTSGTANDWYYGDEVKNTLGQPAYGYTIELRPSSASFNGFVQPASEILPTGEEEVEAFFAFAKYVLDNPIG